MLNKEGNTNLQKHNTFIDGKVYELSRGREK